MITNMVIKILFDKSIDKLEKLDNYSYYYETFPGVPVNLEDKVTILLFRSNQGILTGVRDVNKLKKYLDHIISLIKEKLGIDVKIKEIKILNVTYHIKLKDLNLNKEELNLEEIFLKIPQSIYEPDIFPAVVVIKESNEKNEKTTYVIFKNSINITGVKRILSLKEIKEMVYKDILKKLDVKS